MYNVGTIERPVAHIEAGDIIRFKITSKPNGPIRLRQGIVLDVRTFDNDPDLIVLSIQNDTQRGYYLQYFDPSDTVNVVGYVNEEYLDFRDSPEHFTS